MELLKIDNLSFRYDQTAVLHNVSYTFEEGKIYAITGRSGSGKTTLLALMSGLASPTQGNIYFKGDDIRNMDKYVYRSRCIGVIFQSYNLLANLTALENVLLSVDISGIGTKDKKALAQSLLYKVGLEDDEINRRILKLSGGQQQRVAIARALSYNPDVIMADEPTGNLDGETQGEIINIFRELTEEGKCVIIVTHSPTVAQAADVVHELTKSVKSDKPEKIKKILKPAQRDNL